MADSIDSLARRTGEALRSAGARLATAESCTGGWVAMAVTSIAGSSEWFERGFVTYTNESKSEMLGVAQATLAAHGAVSEATAREMAAGALAASRATVALSVTGVAGPGGGSAEKPVGMVCFAWADARGVRSEMRTFPGDREAIRRASVIRALEGVLESLDAGTPQA